MTHLRGAALVLPDRVLPAGTLHIDQGRITRIDADVDAHARDGASLSGHIIVP